MVGQFLGRLWCVVWVSSRSKGPSSSLLLTFSSHPLYFGIEFEEDLNFEADLGFILFVFDC